MTKYTQMLGRVVTISTYAIMFCVVGNMVMPALIVESVNAQAITSATTAQPKLSTGDQKLLDKAQADTKAALYKQFGLTKSEIAFSDSFDMNSVNQKVDKYVTYDKNGNATLNVNAYRKDGTVKLSKSNTELVISIANKMISSYNKSVNSIVSTNPKSLNMVAVPNVVITKTITARGVNVTYDVTQKSINTGVGAASRSVPSTYRTQITNWGWTWGFDLFVTNELINSMLTWFSVGGIGLAITGFSSSMSGILGAACLSNPFGWIICGGGAIAIVVNLYNLRSANIACGQRGAYYLYRPYGAWWDYTRVERVC